MDCICILSHLPTPVEILQSNREFQYCNAYGCFDDIMTKPANASVSLSFTMCMFYMGMVLLWLRSNKKMITK